MKIREICNITMGQSPSSATYNENGDGLPFFQGAADFGKKFPMTRVWCSSPLKIAYAGDILISVRAPVGTMNIATSECCIGRGLAAIKVDEDACDSNYFWFALESKISELNNKGSGSTFKAISKSILEETEIPLPELEEQRKIAKILTGIENISFARQQQLAKLDELVKSRFVEMFGDPFLNLMNWNKIKIANAVTVEPQNGMYKPQSNYVTDGTGTPILRIDSFYDGEVTDFSLLKRLVCNEEEKQKYALREDDIIINRVNSIEYLGKCARITGLKEETVYESNMMRMHFDSKRFNPIYIIQLLCSQFIYRQIVNHAKKAINQASINQKDVLDFDIYEPTIELQNTFGGFVKQTEQLKLPIQKSIEQMETLKKALMQQYFG